MDGKKILVVDDDTDFVDYMRAVLEENGYEVDAAYSGEECRAKVTEAKPDLILLDMMMETWSEGSNVVEALRKNPDTKGIPIIVNSAVNFGAGMADAAEAPDSMKVEGYMVKPVKPKALIKQIKRIVGD